MWQSGKRRPLLDDDTAAWHLDNFAWLMREFGGGGDFARSRLVLPRPGYFSTDGETGHALAERLFAQVRRYCLIEDWHVDLIALDRPADAAAIGETFAVDARITAAASFAVDEHGVLITYSPEDLGRPMALIATFAHELAHYLVASADTPPLCTEDEEEFLTDLAACFLGFGVFLANARFEHQVGAGTYGWLRRGYLPERDLVFATAIFLAVKGLDPIEARDALDPHLGPQLDQALADLEGRGEIAELQRLAAS
ncbi:hypothetical protein [Acuticoccus sp. I52.16.1]|uniref:hypothetical protein n=1 Tax=Acuticoccus sp. I52.16.1 TaxID=2928472 RepID=UPI001FD43257|nr:hypothetical protein [Acuticoccus sp. I52.16.1]UOM35530.1 hypothetical protein MRB58_04790 [Acuticoccus sp. I52.16.1]